MNRAARRQPHLYPVTYLTCTNNPTVTNYCCRIGANAWAWLFFTMYQTCADGGQGNDQHPGDRYRRRDPQRLMGVANH